MATLTCCDALQLRRKVVDKCTYSMVHFNFALWRPALVSGARLWSPDHAEMTGPKVSASPGTVWRPSPNPDKARADGMRADVAQPGRLDDARHLWDCDFELAFQAQRPGNGEAVWVCFYCAAGTGKAGSVPEPSVRRGVEMCAERMGFSLYLGAIPCLIATCAICCRMAKAAQRALLGLARCAIEEGN